MKSSHADPEYIIWKHIHASKMCTARRPRYLRRVVSTFWQPGSMESRNGGVHGMTRSKRKTRIGTMGDATSPNWMNSRTAFLSSEGGRWGRSAKLNFKNNLKRLFLNLKFEGFHAIFVTVVNVVNTNGDLKKTPEIIICVGLSFVNWRIFF